MKSSSVPLKGIPGATETVNGGLLLPMPWDMFRKRVSLPFFSFSVLFSAY